MGLVGWLGMSSLGRELMEIQLDSFEIFVVVDVDDIDASGSSSSTPVSLSTPLYTNTGAAVLMGLSDGLG